MRPWRWGRSVVDIVWDIDSKFLSRPSRGGANISSTLEGFLVISQSSFNLECLADECRKVCEIINSQCELHIGMQSFTEFLLLASVGVDVILSIARQFKDSPMIFHNSCRALSNFEELLLLLVHKTSRNLPCTES